jgi:hypothetical protein
MSYFIAFCSKNSLFVPNLALIALGDSHHSQGVMKFATQISPLLNLIVKGPFPTGSIKRKPLKLSKNCFKHLGLL